MKARTLSASLALAIVAAPVASAQNGRAASKSPRSSVFGDATRLVGGLTLGGKYYYGGEATYLPEGGIQDNPEGTVTLFPERTRTDFVIWQLGVTVAIPSRSR